MPVSSSGRLSQKEKASVCGSPGSLLGNLYLAQAMQEKYPQGAQGGCAVG